MKPFPFKTLDQKPCLHHTTHPTSELTHDILSEVPAKSIVSDWRVQLESRCRGLFGGGLLASLGSGCGLRFRSAAAVK